MALSKKPRYVLVALLLCLSMLLPMGAYATPASDENEQDNSSSSTALFSTDYLMMSEVDIAPGDQSDRLVIQGKTYAYFNIDEVSVKLYLQYWNGSSWVDLDYAGEYKEINADYAEGRVTYIVDSGYTYRTKGIHTAKHGNKTESVTTYTLGLSM